MNAYDFYRLLEAASMELYGRPWVYNLHSSQDSLIDHVLKKVRAAPYTSRPTMPCSNQRGMDWPKLHCAFPVGNKEGGLACEDCPLKEAEVLKVSKHSANNIIADFKRDTLARHSTDYWLGALAALERLGIILRDEKDSYDFIKGYEE
jgi:hypothetical protein